ncbi:MAG: aminotransferase class III-fold pyridoxal phosphate-dependent enzyme [Deltaproteobacteria bacterium]|nr:aminotransferase class III-fold pyridoxal phosphate-dependent enzyme [Deltaproteobacteria bacterium]
MTDPISRYRKSKKLLARAKKVIPLASQTFSKSHIQYPEASPYFLVRGKGSRVWDVDGNEYIDFVNGLLPVILGYCDPDVDKAVMEQMKRGVTFSLASPLECELAEMLVDLIPCAEMVRFGKSGSDATAGAVRVARAYTGRERVAVCGYHGWQDWYIGSTVRNKGVPECVRRLTHPFTYNDLPSLERLFDQYPGEIAAVILEPMNVEDPAPRFLEGVKEVTHKNGAILVFDEIITGFRYALGGAQELFGVVPDLAAVGKSMANGYPISAVVGRKELMKEMEEVFFSFTFGGETLSIAAAIATIQKLMKESVIQSLWDKGQVIMDGVFRIIQKQDLGGVIQVRGKQPWSLLDIRDHEKFTSWEIKSLIKQEMLRRGILISASHNLSYSHSSEDLETLLRSYDEVMGLLRKALDNGNLPELLIGNPIEPIFKVR